MVDDALREFRQAQAALGLSHAEVGRAVGLSKSQVGRLARGENRHVTVDQLCRLHAAVGLTTIIRAHPFGDPIRDAGQVRLLERFRTRLSPTIRLRTEVPLRGQVDPRAWDAVLDGHGCVDAVEAETRLGDVQATIRRVQLKARDDSTIDHVVLLVADTRANRRVLRAVRENLRGDFPLDTGQVLISLATGRCPQASGIVVL